MNESPQKENGYVGIANELVEALARTNLSPYESRFLWCVFRKTYGWNKKEDWISISQIVEITGMHKAHISRAKSKLLARKIVTQTGNKIGLNKSYSQWRELPKQVTVTQTGNSVTSSGNDPPPIQVITPPPKQAYTKDTTTKDILQKTVPEEKNDERDGRTFREILVREQWCDEHYADKTWNQGIALRSPHRENFLRKVGVVISSARHERTKPFAKKVYHEIAGMVNDFGDMARHLSNDELVDRSEH